MKQRKYIHKVNFPLPFSDTEMAQIKKLVAEKGLNVTHFLREIILKNI